MPALASTGLLEVAAAACLVLLPALMPAQVQAQGKEGSALFAVGESGTRKGERSATAPPQLPPAPPAAAVGKKPVAKRASRGKKAVAGAVAPIVLNGRWEDSQCIPLTGFLNRQPLHVKRHYEFGDKRKTWQLTANVHTSSECLAGTRLLTYQGSGTFVVAGKSAGAGDSYEATFKVNNWSAIPETRDGVMTLLNGRCGSGDFEKGRPLDLSLTGCPALGIRPLAQAPRVVEMVRVSEGKVFLGSSSFVPGGSDARQAQLIGYGPSRTP